MKEKKCGDIMLDKDYEDFRCALSAKCKELAKQGRGNNTQASDLITVEELNDLRRKGVIGTSSPKSLINAMFLVSMYFGFRGRKEIYQLAIGDFKVVTEDGVRYLTLVRERITKTRSGERPRSARHGMPRLKSLTQEEQCPVNVYLKLVRKRPESMGHADSPLFLTPRKTYTDNGPWFKNVRMGINTLSNLMSAMTKEGGINCEGRKITNTSVRKFLVSSLLQNNVPVKKIMSMTGHRNPTTVVHYDKVTNKDTETITDILHGQTIEKHVEMPPPPKRQRYQLRNPYVERPQPQQLGHHSYSNPLQILPAEQQPQHLGHGWLSNLFQRPINLTFNLRLN